MAASQIRAGAAYVELFLKDNRMSKGLRTWEGRLKGWGAAVSGIGRNITLGGGALLAGLVATSKAAIEIGSDLVDMSARTGTSIEALGELGHAAEMSGSSMTGLESGLRKMQKMLAGDDAAETLSDLGLSLSNIEELSTDKQFEAIADKIGAIENNAERTATAMKIFGKGGAELIPLMLEGADGIEALRQEARRLGLVMSTEDAQAAEGFGDQLDTLWKVIRMGVANVGSALIPTLSELTDYIVRAAATAGAWIKANRPLIVSLAKVLAIVVAVGSGLVIAGGVLTLLGGAAGGLAAIMGGVGTAISAVAGVIAFLISPIGIAIAAIVALGTYFATTTTFIGDTATWLSEVFGSLTDYVGESFQGIKDALSAGDFALAAKILWLSVKVAWETGMNSVLGLWTTFRDSILDKWTSLKTLVAETAVMLWAGINKAFTTGAELYMKGVFALLRSYYQVLGYLGKDTKSELMGLSGLEIAYGAKFQTDRSKIDADSQQQVDSLEQAAEAERRKRASDTRDELASSAAELAALKAERASLLRNANDKAALALKSQPAAQQAKQAASSDALDMQSGKVQGTFSTIAAAKFGGNGSAAEQTAKSTAATAANTAIIKNKISTIGMKANKK